MNDNTTLAQQMVAAAPAAPRHVNLRTNSKRVAVTKVWGAKFRGARKDAEPEGFVAIYSMAHPVGVTGACENTGRKDIRDCVPFLSSRDNIM